MFLTIPVILFYWEAGEKIAFYFNEFISILPEHGFIRKTEGIIKEELIDVIEHEVPEVMSEYVKEQLTENVDKMIFGEETRVRNLREMEDDGVSIIPKDLVEDFIGSVADFLEDDFKQWALEFFDFIADTIESTLIKVFSEIFAKLGLTILSSNIKSPIEVL